MRCVLPLFAAVLLAPAQPPFTRITDPAHPVAADAAAGRYAGAAWVDVNGDGLPDLFRNRTALFLNAGSGQFSVSSSDIGQGLRQTQGSGSSWADFDNDGDLDCFISGGSSALYRNDGGTFTRITAGVIGDAAANAGWACAWGDYDNDGFVDLVITFPNGFVGVPNGPLPNHLLRNEGNGTFRRVLTTDVTAGLAPYTVASWIDDDRDGDLDLYIGSGPAGSVAKDFLYRNLLTETGTAHLQRITAGTLANDLVDGQVWNFIDYDNDGDLDAYLTNYGGSNNNLYRNDGGVFTKLTAAAAGPIVSGNAGSLSNVWEDFDNDGDIDCFVTRDAGTSLFYRNNGDGTFARIDTSAVAQVSAPHIGAAAADYDNDGDMDLYVTAHQGANELYRNDLPPGRGWLKFSLTGTLSNRAAIGAVVRVKAVIGGTPYWQERTVSAQNSFNGHSSFTLHMGLGDAAQADSVRVLWPSGFDTVLTAVAKDQTIALTESVPAHTLRARFTYDIVTEQVPFTVHFTDLSFAAPGSSPVSYAWDFDGDGVTDAGTSSPAWTYTTPGTYTVRLVITDGTASDTVRRTAAVAALPSAPVLLFDASPVTLGTVSALAAFADTVFMVRNEGKAGDTLQFELSYGNVKPDSALLLLPVSAFIGPNDSATVTLRIFPQRIVRVFNNTYGPKLRIRSAHAGTVLFEKAVTFRMGDLQSARPGPAAPAEYRLEQNRPNPFNPSTVIRFSLKESGPVRIRLYTVLGEEVETVVEEEMPAGDHSVRYDAARLASGVYLYRLTAGDFTAVRRMVLVR